MAGISNGAAGEVHGEDATRGTNEDSPLCACMELAKVDTEGA
jgi:hypothetical protein